MTVMSDKERADLYAKALAAVIDQFGLAWHSEQTRLIDMYDIAIEALTKGQPQ